MLLLCTSTALVLAVAGAPSTTADQPQTTQEHLRSAAWWPTRPTSDASAFTGSAACQRCHADLFRTQQTSQMAHTLMHAAPSAVHASELHSAYHLGDFTYTLHPQKSGLQMQVSGDGQQDTALLQWIFGSGDVGQSFLWQQGTGFRESRFNYFASLDAFGATPGRLHGTPLSMNDAVGRPIEPFEARTCFACHTSFASADLKTITPGVGCESCHGPGRDHVLAMQQKPQQKPSTRLAEAKLDRHILSPDDLTPTQQIDLCGSCHSTSWDVRLMGAVGVQTARFPAYRLEKSRCWLATKDVRLVCTGCHDPHAPLQKNEVAYDDACLTCHTAKDHSAKDVAHTAAACPVATTKCVSCHMPRAELPEMHASFTDHDIRIVRNSAVFPD